MFFAHTDFRHFDRKALDAEMRETNKMGIAQAKKKPERSGVTDEEELELWRQNLLGGQSAESLLNTLYFYNGKLFGLRPNEHRLLRISNIVLVNNLIIFDESLSKTFHGGLKDLKKQARYIKHICHQPICACNHCIVCTLIRPEKALSWQMHFI